MGNRAVLDKFLSRTRFNIQTGCLEWTGKTNGSGYGSYGNTGAHRFAWQCYYCPIPAGLFVLHHCDNRICVRREHLFLGTALDNARDCARKNRQNGAAKAHHGESHGRAKLTWEVVREIRQRHAVNPGRGRSRKGPYLLDTAREFEVSSGLISQVVAGKIWPEEVMPNV